MVWSSPSYFSIDSVLFKRILHFLSVEYSEIIQQRIRFAHIELRGNKLPVKIDAYTNYELFGFLLLLWILEMVIVDGIFAIWNSS